MKQFVPDLVGDHFGFEQLVELILDKDELVTTIEQTDRALEFAIACWQFANCKTALHRGLARGFRGAHVFGYLGIGAQLQRGGADTRERVHLRRSEEHTSELQSLMRISYAVFCLQK